ncbi:peroxiredoxin-6-like [Argonauta hians]
MVNLGEIFPNFHADSTIGPIQFHDFVGDSWCILFSHPADFTPVCTTELSRVCQLASDFKKRGVKLCALSCDDVESHKAWTKDILSYSKQEELPYPIVSDKTRSLATKLGMIDPEEKDIAGMPLTARSVFIVGPDKKLKLSILYPATTGRNFSEILRVVDSLQLTAKHKVATPVEWVPGGDCMVVPSVKEEEESTLFPKGVKKIEVPSQKNYLRMTPAPI